MLVHRYCDRVDFLFFCCFLMRRRPPRSTRTDTLFPYTTLFRSPMEVNLTGDVKSTLEALLPLLRAKTDGSWRESIKSWNDDWQQVLTERAHAKANPVNPQRVFTELSPRLPDGVILTSDSGSCANWYARDIKMRRGKIGRAHV